MPIHVVHLALSRPRVAKDSLQPNNVGETWKSSRWTRGPGLGASARCANVISSGRPRKRRPQQCDANGPRPAPDVRTPYVRFADSRGTSAVRRAGGPSRAQSVRRQQPGPNAPPKTYPSCTHISGASWKSQATRPRNRKIGLYTNQFRRPQKERSRELLGPRRTAEAAVARLG
jgi:hypothetical protein